MHWRCCRLLVGTDHIGPLPEAPSGRAPRRGPEGTGGEIAQAVRAAAASPQASSLRRSPCPAMHTSLKRVKRVQTLLRELYLFMVLAGLVLPCAALRAQGSRLCGGRGGSLAALSVAAGARGGR